MVPKKPSENPPSEGRPLRTPGDVRTEIDGLIGHVHEPFHVENAIRELFNRAQSPAAQEQIRIALREFHLSRLVGNQAAVRSKRARTRIRIQPWNDWWHAYKPAVVKAFKSSDFERAFDLLTAVQKTVKIKKSAREMAGWWERLASEVQLAINDGQFPDKKTHIIVHNVQAPAMRNAIVLLERLGRFGEADQLIRAANKRKIPIHTPWTNWVKDKKKQSYFERALKHKRFVLAHKTLWVEERNAVLRSDFESLAGYWRKLAHVFTNSYKQLKKDQKEFLKDCWYRAVHAALNSGNSVLVRKVLAETAQAGFEIPIRGEQ